MTEKIRPPHLQRRCSHAPRHTGSFIKLELEKTNTKSVRIIKEQIHLTSGDTDVAAVTDPSHRAQATQRGMKWVVYHTIPEIKSKAHVTHKPRWNNNVPSTLWEAPRQYRQNHATEDVSLCNLNVQRSPRSHRCSPFRAQQQLPEVQHGLFSVFPMICLHHDVVVHRC